MLCGYERGEQRRFETQPVFREEICLWNWQNSDRQGKRRKGKREEPTEQLGELGHGPLGHKIDAVLYIAPRSKCHW